MVPVNVDGIARSLFAIVNTISILVKLQRRFAGQVVIHHDGDSEDVEAFSSHCLQDGRLAILPGHQCKTRLAAPSIGLSSILQNTMYASLASIVDLAGHV